MAEFKRIQMEKGIRQLGPDRWEVQVHIGRDPATGKLRQVSRTTRKGIAGARRLRARLMTEVGRGEHGGTTGTFGALLDEWIMQGERNGRSPNTIASYRKKIDATIRPALGGLPLDKITTHTLDAFYGRLLKAGTTPATVMHYHRIIAAALHQAEKWGWVDRNVAGLAQPPPVPRKKLTVPPPKWVRALIESAAASRSPEWATIITVAALTGLRRGELCGLQWTDVDWPGSAITVRRSIWQTKDGWGEKDPKSHQVRRLVLGEHALSVLAGRRERVADAAALAEVRVSETAYIFSPELGGTRPMLPGAVTLAFGRVCRKMEATAVNLAEEEGRGIRDTERWPYRFHDLRHYTATELFRAGHNPRTVSDRLGHADPSLTLRVYTHDTVDQAQAAADSLESGLLALTQ
jgi:integrase